MSEDPDRRGFLKVATCAIGGGVGLVVVAPALRACVAPTNAETVTTPSDPIDVGAVDRFRVGAPWQRVDVIAAVVRDAWVSAHDVVLGGAWVRRTSESQLVALSSVCPHVGCAVGWDDAARTFLCPCHNSRWTDTGARIADTGPAKRDLDPLPIEVKDGRLRLTWVRYKLDTATREPA